MGDETNAPKVPQLANLTKQQKRAVKLLAEGATPEEASAKIGISTRTMYRWRDEELFNAELQKARERHAETLKLKDVSLEAIGSAAMQCIHQCLIAGDGKVAIWVADKLRLMDGAKVETKKFVLRFGQMPNDAPPPPLKIVVPDSKERQA